jgi:hypothetical protein
MPVGGTLRPEDQMFAPRTFSTAPLLARLPVSRCAVLVVDARLAAAIRESRRPILCPGKASIIPHQLFVAGFAICENYSEFTRLGFVTDSLTMLRRMCGRYQGYATRC